MSNSTEPNLTGRAAASKRAPESVLYIHTYIGTSHLCVRARSGIERAEVQRTTRKCAGKTKGVVERSRQRERMRDCAHLWRRGREGERECACEREREREIFRILFISIVRFQFFQPTHLIVYALPVTNRILRTYIPLNSINFIRSTQRNRGGKDGIPLARSL